MTRRNFLFASLVAEAPPGPAPRVRPPEPEIPPEVAERAARFRAELAARGSAPAPTGRIVWQEPDEPTTPPVPPWRQ
jgi:hypothetical protein